MTLTYSQAIDVVANNDVVLNVCKALAENLQVPYKRVQDELGGSYGFPSPLAGGAKPAEETEGGERRLEEAATDASGDADADATPAEPVQTEWKVALFVQPDPRAGTVDPQETLDALNDPSALAAVTAASTAFGAPSATAETLTEVAVAWAENGEPTGEGQADGVLITGTMTAKGWGYCVETGRRLEEEATATEGGDAETEGGDAAEEVEAKPTATKPAPKEKVNYSRAMTQLNEAGDGHEF